MGFAEFKAVLKTVGLASKRRVVLEVADGELKGKIDMLDSMVDSKVTITIDSEVVRYNVQIDARTEKPIKSYRVDDSGIVQEVKPEGEQLEMDLGLPKDKHKIKEVREETEREIVDEFILSLLSPTYDDMPYPFYAWVSRIVEDGDTYSKIAGELGWSSGKIAELLDEYRARVAPLAAKWDEWRQSKSEQPSPQDGAQEATGDESADEAAESDDDLPPAAEGEQQVDQGEDVQNGDPEDTLSDWEREVLEGGNPQLADQEDLQPADIETIILTEKPRFEDIPYDFPALLARKKAGEKWVEIANSIGTRSTILQVAWSKYKKRVADQRGGTA